MEIHYNCLFLSCPGESLPEPNISEVSVSETETLSLHHSLHHFPHTLAQEFGDPLW